MDNKKIIEKAHKALNTLAPAIEKAGGHWSVSRPEGGIEIRISIPKKADS